MSINKVKLASKLADIELRKKWQPYKGNGKYIPIDFYSQADNTFYYTDEAQESYNLLYDMFFNIITETEYEG